MNEAYLKIIEEQKVQIKLLMQMLKNDFFSEKRCDSEHNSALELSQYLEELAQEIKSSSLNETYTKDILYTFSKALLSREVESDDIMAGVI